MPTGLFVTHPLTGERVAVWVGNYVLMTYGDGAVMGVPAHDERDFAFANKYGLPIKQVIAGRRRRRARLRAWQDWYAEHGVVRQLRQVRRPRLPSGSRRDRRGPRSQRPRREAGAPGACATGASRASATGAARSRSSTAPTCGDVPVPDEDLPVVLPEDCVPDGTGNPLNKRAGIPRVQVPEVRRRRRGARPTRWTPSSIRRGTTCASRCPDQRAAMVDERADYWMPMDQYIGGIEHAILHLLYARFWTKVMRDLGLVKVDEPFTQPAHAGHGAQPDLLPRRPTRDDVTVLQPGRSRREARRQGRPHRRWLERRRRSRWSTAASARCRSRRTTASIRRRSIERVRRRHRAPVHRCSRRRRSRRWSGPTRRGRRGRFLRRVWAFAYELQNIRHAVEVRTCPARCRPSLRVRREVHAVLKQANYDMPAISTTPSSRPE